VKGQPPILIFGVPRSGTTLLRTILNAHPAIACGPEVPWLARHQEASIQALSQALTEGEYSLVHNFGVPPWQVRRRIRELIDGLFTDFAATQGKARWAHKTPDDCLYAGFFTQLFPDAKYLHIERHPLDVALSTARISTHRRGVSPWHENQLLIAPGCALANNLFNAALRWRSWNERLRAALRETDCHHFAYEEMVTAPEKTFADLFNFLGETFSPELLEYGKSSAILPANEWGSADVRRLQRITASRTHRWRKELASDEVRLLCSIAGAGAEPDRVPMSSVSSAARLASATELESPLFRGFMEGLNGLAAVLHLRTFTDWSKVWEYPWLWFNGLAPVDAGNSHILALGSELSPLPWLLALCGAHVTLFEADPAWTPAWEKLRSNLNVRVDWHITATENLPLPAASADAVVSFSSIQQMHERARHIDEIARVLKPGARLCLSFDVCEQGMGMTYPAWSGRALTLAAFEREIWLHPAFGNQTKPAWNLGDIAAFKAWHLRSAPHHNYVTGAAVLVKNRT
jgi:protein-tyrosine sulfotransferase